MGTYSYGKWIATDDQGNPVQNATGNLYDPVADPGYTTPLTVDDLLGNPVSQVSTDGKSYMGQEFTADVCPIIWMANGTTPIKLWAPEYFKTAAENAATEAAASAAAAQAAIAPTQDQITNVLDAAVADPTSSMASALNAAATTAAASAVPTAIAGALTTATSPGGTIRTVTDDQYPNRTTRTKHAPAFNLWFAAVSGIQDAVDAAAPTSGTVMIDNGNTTITTPVQITTNGLTITSNGYMRGRIMADGCNGIEVAAGVSDFQMINIEVTAKVLYSTTANTQVGIKINGTTDLHCQNFVFRDVFCNGFHTGFYCRYLWSSQFYNCRTLNGLIGLAAYGLSVNNHIIGGALNVAGAGSVAGSRCVALLGYESDTDSTPVASEGWIIAPTLLDGGEVGVEITGNAHIEVAGIIDHCGMYGVLIQGNGVNFGGNCDIHPSYIGMNTTAGVAAIRNANTVANTTLVKTRVHDVHAVVYTGATCTYGINQSGNNGLMIIRGNTLRGFTTADIYLQSAGNIVAGNSCHSVITNNIQGTANSLTMVANNFGHVLVNGAGAGTPFSYVMQGNNRVAYYSAAPTATANAWAVGDRVINSAPAVGSPKAWVCVTAGSPGTWVSEGNL